MPSPSNSAQEVVDAQFRAFSRDYDSRSIGDAFAHLSPDIISKHNLDESKFKQILKGKQMDGILGCAEWEVFEVSSPSDERRDVKVKMLPKPIAGCVKTSGVAGQGGITWPHYYKWEMRKMAEGPRAGCWMLEQMVPQAPPNIIDAAIDVEVRGSSAPEAAASNDAKTPKLVQKRVEEMANLEKLASS
jgi:hypothetical protein